MAVPGVFVKNIGGGGKLVPLIGEMQPLSCISCCNMHKYEVITQNSSNVIEISEPVFNLTSIGVAFVPVTYEALSR